MIAASDNAMRPFEVARIWLVKVFSKSGKGDGRVIGSETASSAFGILVSSWFGPCHSVKKMSKKVQFLKKINTNNYFLENRFLKTFFRKQAYF